MYKALAISIFFLLWSVHSSADDAFIFIGEAIMVERSEKSCQEYISKKKNSDGQLEEICMDRVFNYRYEVKQTLKGTSDVDHIDFIGLYHYWGLPDYTTLKDALVVLRMSNHGYFLQGVEVVMRHSNNWVVCDEWDEDNEECTNFIPVDQFLSEKGYSINK